MPRAGLSEQRVVAEAEQLADSGEPVTLAALALRLGVQVPSLYKHVAGADALQQLVSVRAKAELAEVLIHATVGKAGPEALAALSFAYRDWAMAHPERYATTLRAPRLDDPRDMAAGSQAIEVIFAAIGAYGLDDENDLIDATRYIRATLHGWVTLCNAGAFELPDLERSFAAIVRTLDVSLRDWGVVTI